MNADTKKIIFKILIVCYVSCSLCIMFSSRISGDYKSRMYYDFKDFGSALEEFNDELFGILIVKDYELNNKILFNKHALKSFERSKLYSSKFGSRLSFYDFEDMYTRTNEVIVNIFKDGIVSKSEQKYIITLYDYNKELIDNYKGIFGLLYDSYNVNLKRKLKRNINSAYADFCENADAKLNSEKYMYLINYQGDYSDFNYIRAENFIYEIFSKLVPNQQLKYNNVNEVNSDMLVYKTHANDDGVNILEKNPEPQYEVEYNKETKELTVRLFSYIVPPQRLKEEEIDSLADEIIKKFNYDGFLYERELTVDSEGELNRINYLYINKIGDVYDKQQEVRISITSYGIVDEFYIVDYDSADCEHNFIDSEEILHKINDNAEVIGIYKVKNIKNEVEYLVQLLYEEVNYDLVFNGATGQIKNYSRNDL